MMQGLLIINKPEIHQDSYFENVYALLLPAEKCTGRTVYNIYRKHHTVNTHNSSIVDHK